MTLLHARQISKRFGGIQALDSVDVEFEAGQVHGLIGPNGSGKSTLLSILSGALAPDEGSIEVAGTDVRHLRSPRAARNRGIQRMPQELALVPGMSVADNVVLGAEPHLGGIVIRRAVRQQVTRTLSRVGLDVDPDLSCDSLRPSQQRLLMLARTLYRSAKVLIADEPTAGLLPDDAHAVSEALLKAADDGLCVIYVSHHLDEVARIADRVTVLRDGRVVRRFTERANREHLLGELLSTADPDADVERPRLGDPLLEVSGLAGGSLRRADLTVHRHEVVGLAGLLGSGREDALPAILGLTPNRAGTAIVGGRNIHSPRSAARSGVGYMAGDRSKSLIPALDIGAHVSIASLSRFARLGVVERSAEHKAVATSLTRVGVKTSTRLPLSSLSGGNQQRALLARWMVADVDLLLVDEPAVGVDVAARRTLLQELRRFAERGALLIASSDVDDLTEICDRVICFRGGTVSADVLRSAGWSATIHDATV